MSSSCVVKKGRLPTRTASSMPRTAIGTPRKKPLLLALPPPPKSSICAPPPPPPRRAPPEKKRRLTAEQVQLLERSFEEENKLEPERKTELARRLGMAPRQVAVWFQNRRARWKTKQLETDYDRLKAAYDALAADHQGLLADNDSLRAQVVTLTEKLQGKETSPSATNAAQDADHLDEHTAASGTEKLLEQQLRDDLLSMGDCTGHGALSSEEEDGGVVSDEGCSFHLPDTLFAAAEVTHHGGEEAQLFNWTSWYWNN